MPRATPSAMPEGSRFQIGLLAASILTAMTVLRAVVAAPPAVAAGADGSFGDGEPNVIAGTLDLPDGTSATFQVRDGSLLFAQRDREAAAVAFAPQVRDAGVAWLPLLVDERAVRQAGRTAPRTTPVGSALAVSAGDDGYKLLATRVGPADRPLAQPRYTSLRPQQLLDVHGRSGDGTCCVAARGWTVCGATVEIDHTSCRATPIIVADNDAS